MTSSRSVEFILLVALLNAVVAMSIDMMLPAVGIIAAELGASDPNHRQFIITALFMGMTLGTLIYGPASDSIGRKPAIFIGLVIFALGATICLFARSFEILLLGRFIQGLGAASPGFVAMAMVRDGHAGSAMARIMSFVMTVFMLVPILAPSIGQLILFVAHWRAIFVLFLGLAIVAALWLGFRQEETLPKDKRRPYSLRVLADAGYEAARNPVTMGYTFASGFIFSGLVAYLGTSQQIFSEQYQQGALFALWFAGFAVALALAMIVNGRFVMRFGMRKMTRYALYFSTVMSALFVIVAIFYDGMPPLPVFGLYVFLNFFCTGLLFGNYNALALEPVGHIAGMAAALSGFLSSLLSIIGGSLVGQAYHGTVTPLVIGFAIFGALAVLVTEWAEGRRAHMLEAGTQTA